VTRLRITPLSLGMLALLWSELRSSVQDMVSIKSINVEHKNPLDNTGIGDWSRRYISTAYITPVVGTAAIIASLALIILDHPLSEPGVLTLALLPPARMEDSRWLLFARVSTSKQLDNTSKDKQLSDLRVSADNSNGKVVEVIERAESGASMDRKSLEKILEMAQNDEFDVLGVWKLDRLTRSGPWEGIRYLSRLRDHDIVLYSDSHGFFDWEDRRDFDVLVKEVLFSREWYSRIQENAEDGQLKLLKQGKYPFGNPPFGYTKDEEKFLHLTERGEEVIPAIYKHYIKLENRAKTTRRINRDLLDEKELTDSQIKTVLENPLCVGQLTLKNKVVSTDPELQCVSKETYNKVQGIINERAPDSPDGETIPGSIEDATRRFGPEFVGKLFNKFDAVCPDCGGELTDTESTTLIRDTHLIEYACGDCEFRGPLFGEQEINKLDSTLPLGCPFCISVDEMSAEKLSTSTLEYLYTCNQCDNQFAVDVPPNKYKRAFNNPESAYRWRQTRETDGDTPNSSEDTAFIWGTVIQSDGGTRSDDNDDDDDAVSPMSSID